MVDILILAENEELRLGYRAVLELYGYNCNLNDDNYKAYDIVLIHGDYDISIDIQTYIIEIGSFKKYENSCFLKEPVSADTLLKAVKQFLS